MEDVYWRYRIWPKANAGPKSPREKVISQAQIEKKVEDYLRNSQALEELLATADPSRPTVSRDGADGQSH
jgi:hypothetical protein